MNPSARPSTHGFLAVIVRQASRTLLTLVGVASGAGLALAPVPAAAQDTGFACTNRSGGATEIRAAMTSVRFAHHDGYDRIVFGFANARAVPTYTLTQQASASFGLDARGGTRTIQGSAGLRAVFSGTLWTNGVPLADAKPSLPVIREVAAVGNFEGVTSYGIGLSQQACFRSFELIGPSRLVIDFATPSDQVTANSPAALAQTGHAASAVSVVNQSPLAGDRWILGLAGLGATLLLVLGGTLLTTRRRLSRR